MRRPPAPATRSSTWSSDRCPQRWPPDFAPSPTGFLHIGGARTALFNWLFARRHEGEFLLRIEDTDRARSTPEARRAILEGLRWLGLDWDGDAVSQSGRIARHQEVAERLLRSGRAYRCYATPEEIAAAREAARRARAPFRFGSPWRDRTPGTAPVDSPFAVRLRAPRAGRTAVEDIVQGTVNWSNDSLDDLVLLRSDGTPTYMLAVVVDDHDMGITHVIRGDDHLTNAARQCQVFDALEWPRPRFAHVPLIHGADGAKYSKRHGAVGVEPFAAEGYLPAAMRNYLARLGWAHGDEEFFPTGRLIEVFTLEAIGRSAARFDLAKLRSLNGRHIREASPDELLERFLEYLAARPGQAEVGEGRRGRIRAILPELAPRATTLAEMTELAGFVLTDSGPEPDEKAQRHLQADALDRLTALTPALASATDWDTGGTGACDARLLRADWHAARQGRATLARRPDRQNQIARDI